MNKEVIIHDMPTKNCFNCGHCVVKENAEEGDNFCTYNKYSVPQPRINIFLGSYCDSWKGK